MQVLRNIKVRMKFMILISLSIFASILITLYGSSISSNMAKNSEKMYEETFIPNTWISDSVQTNLQIDSILIEMMFIDDLQEKQALHNKLNEGVDEVLANFATYEKMDLTQEERDQIANFYEAVNALTGNQDKMIELALAGKNDEAYAIFVAVVKDARQNLITALKTLNDIKEKQTAAISAENVQSASDAGVNMLIYMVILAIILIILSNIFLRTITNPINRLLETTKLAQQGDFTTRTNYVAKDEIGQTVQAFNDIMDTVQATLKNVQSSAIEVDDNAANLSANIQQSGATTEHVVAAVQEITVGSEETKKSLEQNSYILANVTDNFSNIAAELGTIETIAGESVIGAKEGTLTVEQNVVQMEKIQQTIHESNAAIASLSKRVGEVDNILNVVNSISEQTNLLALNAAIEAARAGEHGKGFAVVADEVRKLAEQSLDSTKSISQILSNIKEDTKQTVENMTLVLEEADKGLASTQLSAVKFNEIHDGTTKVAPLVTQMAQTVQQMNNELNHFVNNSEEILKIAINNAANSEEVSASTEQQMSSTTYMQNSAQALADVASNLNEILKQYKI